jgi:hypothetical protein
MNSIQLPTSDDLPISKLSACFNNTTATYKFYWLLSIIESIERRTYKISKKELFSRMVANAWFTINYYKIHFGKQDIIQDAIHQIKNIENITIEEKKEVITQKLITSSNTKTNNILSHFDKNVPHWFLSPWFPKLKSETDSSKRNRIYAQSKVFSQECIYGLQDKYIEINPAWRNYLSINAKILKDFCYWNLVLYLQGKNPNIPDIPNKLIKPTLRNSLIKQRKKFWDLVINELGTVECIYTGKKLTIGNYAVEHFIPYSFVSHNLIWNLIPANESFNSVKSNKLPSLDKYFKPFFNLQKTAVEIVTAKNPTNIFLEDYLSILPNFSTSLSEEKFKDIIQPLITIASNNGFELLV